MAQALGCRTGMVLKRLFDDSSLVLPTSDGEVLVLPDIDRWQGAMVENRKVIDACDTLLLGRPLGWWRSCVRETVLGGDVGLVIATGHQPGLQPGHWRHETLQRQGILSQMR